MFPEVSLTSDFVRRIEERFGFTPDVWHSKISASMKTKTLKNIINGTSKIIVGARSALFLPYKKLGMIILDEEHDTSYKQEEKGIYHARDMSVVKASIENIPLILTSATPSLETIFNVFKKKYHKVSIKNKFFSNVENKIKIIDMRKEKLGKDQYTDVLTISYSSTDYIGHNFGVDAKETQDAYLRLDLEIERLLNFLDIHVGKNEYTLFLTAPSSIF